MLVIVAPLPLIATTSASHRSATFASVPPAALRTVAVIVACELPSYRMRSGEAISTTDRPSVDGPVSPGADCFAQAAAGQSGDGNRRREKTQFHMTTQHVRLHCQVS